jgi:rSAM/selenodomain-associated transferase 1
MTEVVIFGREPRRGEVKSRLAANIGDRRAAELYRALLDHTVAVVAASGLQFRLSLAAAPVEPPDGLRWEVQPPGGMGDRLAAAFERAFGRGESRVLVVGSDCPELEPEHLRRAAAALERAALVLGPATDGGYWLIGQRAPGVAGLLDGIPWSTRRTFEATTARARAAGVDPLVLDELVDLDRREDLVAVRARGRMPPRLDAAVRHILDE